MQIFYFIVAVVGGLVIAAGCVWLFWQPEPWRKHLAVAGFSMAGAGVAFVLATSAVHLAAEEFEPIESRCTTYEALTFASCGSRGRFKRGLAFCYAMLLGGGIAGAVGLAWRFKNELGRQSVS